MSLISFTFAKKINMRVLQLKPHHSDSELKREMNSQLSVHDFKDWQIIYSVKSNPGKKVIEIADILCVTKSKIYDTVQNYNRLGITWKSDIKWGGRREERCIMTLEMEKEFLQTVEEDALNGQIVTYHQIKSKLEAQIDRKVSDDYIWDMFKRHNWSKKTPRPSHPQIDKAAQEEFKKNSLKIWLPSL
jgi:transposase